jgi:hypothetical protein
MNKRIKELAKEAGFVMWGKEKWNPGYVIDWSCRYDDELTKLVEMIVKECAEIANTAEPYKSNDLIKKHFGVE